MEDVRRQKTHTSPESVRQEDAYGTGTRSHNIRTSSDHVRQENTYDGGRRTSVEYVRQRWKTYVSRICALPECVREEDAYVVDLQMRTPNLHLHGRSWNTMACSEDKRI